MHLSSLWKSTGQGITNSTLAKKNEDIHILISYNLLCLIIISNLHAQVVHYLKNNKVYMKCQLQQHTENLLSDSQWREISSVLYNCS